jgi:hypothetical protein
MILFLLLYAGHYRINTRSKRVILDRFGFLEGATFEIRLTNVDVPRAFAALCENKEYKRIRRSKSLCDFDQGSDPKISQIVPVINGTAVFMGRVNRSIILYPIIYLCGQKHKQIDLSFRFDNQKSLLDARVLPCLISEPITFVFFMALGSVWVVNWALNRRVQNFMHGHYTVAIILTLLLHLFRYLEIVHFSLSDSKSFITNVRIVSKISQQTVVFGLILMIANGICLIRTEMPFDVLIRCFGISVLVTVPPAIFEINKRGWDPLQFEMVSLFIGLRMYYIFKYVQLYNLSVEEFFWEIRLIGGDEITSRTKEFRRFRGSFSRIFWYLAGLVLFLSLDELNALDVWKTRVSTDCLLFVMLCESGWICRLQSVTLVIEADSFQTKNGLKWEEMVIENV